MTDPGLRSRFLKAGMSPIQIDAALHCFEDTGEALSISSQAEYIAARAAYARMDASLPPDELFSAVARYVLSLGVKVAEWEKNAEA